jgi:hypothetical protein
MPALAATPPITARMNQKSNVHGTRDKPATNTNNPGATSQRGLHGRVRPALAVTGGVATPNDGIKAIMAGVDAVQVVSALLRHGPSYVGVMRQALERANYIRMLHGCTR